MTQRIIIWLSVHHKQKTLLVQKTDEAGDVAYTVPYRRFHSDGQPEDVAREILQKDLGIKEDVALSLADIFASQDGRTAYLHIVYKTTLLDTHRAVKLEDSYTHYHWYQNADTIADKITTESKAILGIQQASAENQSVNDVEKTTKNISLVYTDGGSRGNPGPSAAGYVLVDERGTIVAEGGEYLGITTNNQAEYQGVKIGLEAALVQGWTQVECRIDSMLVVNQMKGLYHIKNRDLWPIHERVQELLKQFKKVTFVYVPREQNRLADGMVNKTLDAHQ